MRIETIKLTNFRNYETLTLNLDPGVNVLYGQNGQGKTNILESVYMCTCASSHRTSRDQDLIKSGEHDYQVQLDFESHKRKSSLEIRYLEGIKGDPLRTKNVRQIIHNGIRLEKVKALPGLFNAVIFAPEDMRIVKEGPHARRLFMDLLISQIRPKYFSLISDYNRTLNHRNQLLKKLKNEQYVWSDQSFDFKKFELETWDDALISLAVDIIWLRMYYLKYIVQYAADSHEQISSGKEKLNIVYKTIKDFHIHPSQSFTDDLETKTKDEWRQILKEKFNSIRKDEIQNGHTKNGPHRDDFTIQLNERSVKQFGSQGQQRTAVLSFKIAELKLIRQVTDQSPILLLDDCMSELDVSRRTALIEHMKDCQVLLTCTEKEFVQKELDDLSKWTNISLFEVTNGTIKKQ